MCVCCVCVGHHEHLQQCLRKQPGLALQLALGGAGGPQRLARRLRHRPDRPGCEPPLGSGARAGVDGRQPDLADDETVILLTLSLHHD